MEPESILRFGNAAVIPAWLLLLLAPHWKWSARVICGGLVPLLLAIVYSGLMWNYWGDADADFSSIAGILTLFQNPGLLVAGWLHYLAFDLFIGSWEVRDAQQHGISHWLVAPCLLLTFVFGPIGLGVYLVARAVKLRHVVLGS